MSRSTHGEFPPVALRQYALIADGERGALCGPHGEIVWLCAPRWHDDAVFSALVGGAGAYAVTPTDRGPTRRGAGRPTGRRAPRPPRPVEA